MRVNGPYLRMLREERGYTLREFAKLANVSPAYLSQVESGKRTPTIKTLQKLARALNLAKEELIVLTDPSPELSIATKVKAFRERQGLSQEKLARLAGLAPEYLHEIEQGTFYPPLPVLKRLAQSLGVDVSAIFPAANNSLGAKLKAVRQSQQLTLKELANLADVSPALLSHIEQGRVSPSISTMEKLAGVLGPAACLFIMEDDISLQPILQEESNLKTGSPQIDDKMALLLKHIQNMRPEELDFLIKLVSHWSGKKT